MYIPVVQIDAAGAKGRSVSKLLPAYYGKVIEYLWGATVTHGPVYTDIPLTFPESVRYRTYSSIAEAESEVRAFIMDGDDKRRDAAVTAFREIFPDGLRKDIERLLAADQKRIAEHEQNAFVAKTRLPHPSFVEGGLTVQEALLLMDAGYATLLETPSDMLALSEAGLTPKRVYETIRAIDAALKGVAYDEAQAKLEPERKKHRILKAAVEPEPIAVGE